MKIVAQFPGRIEGRQLLGIVTQNRLVALLDKNTMEHLRDAGQNDSSVRTFKEWDNERSTLDYT